jgi:sugar O-acyltransferase (sialic acid O-acetyltransferase NeuD family)
MKKLGIIGSGDLGQLIAYHAENDGHYNVAGFFDDFRKKEEFVGGKPILGGSNEVEKCFKEGVFDELMIAIGYNHIAFRKQIYDQYSALIPMGRIIHTSSYIDRSCIINQGCFILPGCVLDRNVVLKENVLLNTSCVIAHDSVIEAHTFLAPRVAVAGFVNIGNCCNIGINSSIIDNISICPNTQTGGGTVVIKNINQSGLYVGNPARFIR